MTDREKLVELISQIQYMGGLESRLAEHLLANGVRLESKQETSNENKRWIPVSERLPEQHSSVIVYRKTKSFSMLHYSSALGFHFYDSEWGDVTVDDVTHWMPLPEPPKEV